MVVAAVSRNRMVTAGILMYQGQSGTGNNSLTYTIPFVGTTPGTTLVLRVGSNEPVLSVSDDVNGAWTLRKHTPQGSNVYADIWSVGNTPLVPSLIPSRIPTTLKSATPQIGGSLRTVIVTITFSTAGNYAGWYISEYTGIDSTNPVSFTDGTTAVSSTLTPFTTTGQVKTIGELLVAVIANNNVNGDTFTSPTWTQRMYNNPNENTGTLDLNSITTGAQTTDFVSTVSSTVGGANTPTTANYAMSIVSFNPGKVLKPPRPNIPNTLNGFHQALTFNSRMTRVGQTIPDEVGVVDYTWGATSETAMINYTGGLWHEWYIGWSRDSDFSAVDGGAGFGNGTRVGALQWFQTNHPSWIMYAADKITPARYGGTSTANPQVILDSTQEAVQDWILATYIYPALSVGGFQGISMDNGWNGDSRQTAGHYAPTGIVLSGVNDSGQSSVTLSSTSGLYVGDVLSLGKNWGTSDSAALSMDFIQVSAISGNTITSFINIATTGTTLSNAYSDGDYVGRWINQYVVGGGVGTTGGIGSSKNPDYASANQIAFRQFIQKIHTQFPNASVTLNQQWDGFGNWNRTLATGPTMIFDEGGALSGPSLSVAGEGGEGWYNASNTTYPQYYRASLGINQWLDMMNEYRIMQKYANIGLVFLSTNNPAGPVGYDVVVNDPHTGDIVWTLANYYLIKYDKTFFDWRNSTTQYGLGPLTQPQFSINIGNPLNDFYFYQSKVYARDFSNGWVVVNPDGLNSASITLPTSPLVSWQDTQSALYTSSGSYALEPHSALIVIPSQSTPLFSRRDIPGTPLARPELIIPGS